MNARGAGFAGKDVSFVVGLVLLFSSVGGDLAPQFETFLVL